VFIICFKSVHCAKPLIYARFEQAGGGPNDKDIRRNTYVALPTVAAAAASPCVRNLRMRMRITDYYRGTAQFWSPVETWASSIGFEVLRDHSAAQIGVSCGIVAAHVSVALHERPGELMTLDTTSAVSCDVLREANAFFSLQEHPPPGFNRAWGRPNSRCSDAETVFLGESQCASIASYFAGLNVWQTMDDDDSAGVFLQWPAFDQFLHIVAKRVYLASQQQWFGRRYFAVNTDDSRQTGQHWVSVVIDIQPRDAHGDVAMHGPGVVMPHFSPGSLHQQPEAASSFGEYFQRSSNQRIFSSQ